jgi:hypothetical protein
VGKRIQAADRIVQKGGAYAMAGTATQQNLQTRTFVLAFLANILDATTRKTPLLGGDALNLFQNAIPSILYPDKPRYVGEEGLVDEQFGFSYGDEANSILTAGATDFGFAGMIFYPLLMAALFAISFNFIAKWLKTIPLMFVALSFIFMFLQTETKLTGYFEVLRDSFFFGILLALFMAIPAIRTRA